MSTSNIKGKQIFITGGAGFIGSRLAEKYLSDNKLILFDNFERDSLKTMDIARHPNVEVVRGDILDAELLCRSAKNSNIIVHAAAIAGIDNTVKDPIKTMRVNMIGTANILEAALKTKSSLERLIEFSTSEIFGPRAYMVDEESSAVTGAVGEARWTYAVSKLAGEHLTNAYFRQENLPTVSIRPFNIYGPGQTGEGAISIMIRRALKNETIYIFGDGSQIRAWCYIDDMIKALSECLVNPRAVGQSLNIGNARAVTTIYSLAKTICKVLDSDSEIKFKPALSADIELRIPSIEKAKSIIGFHAEVELDEGIRKTADWIQNNENALPSLPSIFTE